MELQAENNQKQILSLTDEMKKEFEEIVYKLFRYDELTSAEITSNIKGYGIPYLAGINYALNMTPEQWVEYEAITEDSKLIAYDKKQMKAVVNANDLKKLYIKEATLCFDCGIYKIGRDLGKYPR